MTKCVTLFLRFNEPFLLYLRKFYNSIIYDFSMKKLTSIRLSATMFVGAMIVAACGSNTGLDNGGDKVSPENEVRAFGKNFIEKLSANQLDSLKAVYPDIVNADSIATIQSDTIIVVKTAPGQYDMTLAEGVTLKVSRENDGNVSVAESKGLFAFPTDKVDIAKKTGMWNDSLNDGRLSERMKDEDFFKWYENYLDMKSAPNLSMEVGKKKVNKKWGPGDYDGQDELLTQEEQEVKVINNSSEPVSGKDYVISYGISKNTSMDPDIKSSKSTLKTKPGVDIQPNGTATITLYTDYTMWDFKIVDPKIKLKKNNDSHVKKYQPTGNEYQEYLNSKK